MKLFREVIIVFGIAFLGEVISKTLHLPLPGSLCGMLILLALLCSGILKIESIQTISDFLLSHLAFFFIPAGVSLLAYFEFIQDSWLWIIITCLLTTFITMGICGWMMNALLMRKENKHE